MNKRLDGRRTRILGIGWPTLAIAALLVIAVITLSFSQSQRAEASTTVTTTSTTISSYYVSEGDTWIIEPNVSVVVGDLTNYGTIIVRGALDAFSFSSQFHNYGTIIVIDSDDLPAYGNPQYRTQGALGHDPWDSGTMGLLTNHIGGIITIDSKATFSLRLLNEGTFNNHGLYTQNSGAPSTLTTNKGMFINSYNGDVELTNGADFINDGGTITNRGGFGIGKNVLVDNINGGKIFNEQFGSLGGGHPEGSGGSVLRNSANSMISNLGSMDFYHGGIINYGVVDNNSGGTITTQNDYFITGNDGIIYNFGTFNNKQFATINNLGEFHQQCGATFNNAGTFTGNPVINDCAPATFPALHMQDATATQGSVTYAGRQINAEYVNATSSLIGDKIDSISVRLQRIGSPTGIAQIGVFNADLSVKKLFGTLDVATLPTTYQDYEFKLTGTDLYTIQIGDRIGIKYNGGTTANALNVMTDRDAADPFDSNKSYRTRYESSWIVSYAEDMYMTLKQTHDGSSSTTYPITHMSDTTASFASLVSAPRQLMAEYVAPSSQLVGDKIDSITLRLQKVGAPVGIAQVGVFDASLNPKKLFGTIDVATINSVATDYEFKLPAGDPLYTIASADRIGIKYTGGSSSAGINVTPDRDTTDPFDGTNSYRVRYESGWITSTAEDLYMILKQTHG